MDEQERRLWLDSRAGHVTASRIGDVLTKPRKNSKTSVRRNYMWQLINERLIKRSLEEDRRTFFDIKRGERLEPIARVEYEMAKNLTVDSVGFTKHPTIPWSGCSPDGLIGEVGMAQFKCPKRANHCEWLLNGVVPSEHREQMYFELACFPQRLWNDFCSYEEEWPQHLFICRLKRDESAIREIEIAVIEFNAEIEGIMARLPKDPNKSSLEEQLEKSLEAFK